MAENAASDGFRWNILRKVYARITKFHTVVEYNWPHKSAGYDVANRPKLEMSKLHLQIATDGTTL